MFNIRNYTIVAHRATWYIVYMTILTGLILGIVQGLTEFIPVSSSGHLILAHKFLGSVSSNDLSIDAVLQLATVLAVLVYFWKDLWGLLMSFFRFVVKKPIEYKERTLLISIIIGTIPALVLGLILEKYMESMFREAHFVAYALFLGSVLMYVAERFAKQNKELTIVKGFQIGLYQCLALLSGVSRSGSTISGGLLSGLSREEATRFSFLLSFPIILGSGLKKLYDLIKMGNLVSLGLPLGVAFVAAFVVGMFAIHFLIKYLRQHKLTVFVWYRVALAVIIVIFL